MLHCAVPMDTGRPELWQRLLLPGRLIGEALAQDDQFLSLEESCTAGAGSADYDFSSPQFTADIAGKGLPSFDATPFTRQGMLPEIQRFWRSFESRVVLWKYADPMQEMTEYTGVRSCVAAGSVSKLNSNATQPASAGLLEFMRRAAHCGFPQLAYLLSTSNSSRRRRSTFSWRRNKVCVEWQ